MKMLEEKKTRFMDLLKQGEMVFAPCIWDCYSAKAAEMSGFTAALLCMGIVRELFGAGTVFGYTVLPESIYTPVLIFILPAGGFFVFGMLIALANRIKNRKSRAPEEPCARCPMKDSCKTEVGSDG